MTVASTRPPALRPVAEAAATEHVQRGWHIGFSAVLALVTVSAATTGPTWARTLAALGSLLLVAAYVRVGAPALRGGPRPELYAAAVVVGVALLAVASEAVVLLAAVVIPQLFWILSLARATPVAGLVFATVGLSSVGHRDWTVGAWGVGVLVAVGGFGVSIAVAGWLSRVLHLNDMRARLVSELESTRQEMADLHHDVGVLDERARLAGEIHDSLAQGFVSIHLLLASAQRDLGNGQQDRARERVQVAQEQAALHIEESRAIVAALAPVDLDAAGLARSIRTVAERFARELRLDVDLQLDDTITLPEVQRIAVLRALQECLSNVRKHASASRVTVTWRLSGDPGHGLAELCVSDDGRGTDPATAGSGFGLLGLQRRLERAGGSCDMRALEPSGWQVTASLPVDGRDRAGQDGESA